MLEKLSSLLHALSWDWRPGKQQALHIQAMPDKARACSSGVEMRFDPEVKITARAFLGSLLKFWAVPQIKLDPVVD